MRVWGRPSELLTCCGPSDGHRGRIEPRTETLTGSEENSILGLLRLLG